MNREKLKSLVKLLIVPLLISVLFFFLTFSSVKDLSYTTDERSHLVRGVMLIRTGDYRLNQHHPILFNLLHSIPVAFDVDFKTVSLDDTLWTQAKKDDIGMELVWLNGGYEKYSLDFLINARMSAGVLSAVLVFVIFSLIRKYFGFTKAIITTVIFAFSPTVLAHSSLVTTDTAAMFTIFITSLALYNDLRLSKSNSKHFPFFFTICAFFAVISKYTSLLLLPFWLITYFVVVYKGFGYSLKRSILTPILSVVIILFLISAAYGFKFATLYDVEYNNPEKISSTKDHLETLDRILPFDNSKALNTVYSSIKFPFPDYIKGFYDNVVKHNFHGHKTYLLGKSSNGGNPLYFPVAFITKETIPFIFITVFSTVYLARFLIVNRETFFRQRLELAPLYITPIIIAILSLSSSINIGIRHLIPIFPFIALGASYTIVSLLTVFKESNKQITSIAFFLIALHLVLSISHFPIYISYFNQIVGAEKYNYLYLQDSNFDWEQETYIAENERARLVGTDQIVWGKELLSGNINIFTKEQKCIRYRFFRNELQPVRELGQNYYIFKHPGEKEVCNF